MGANDRNGKSASAFLTISEVSGELGLPQHVLRFWETKFTVVKPMKRGGGRRYYRPEDVVLLRRIQGLLYDEGYTIKGAQKFLKQGGVAQSENSDSPMEKRPQSALDPGKEKKLRGIISELEVLRDQLG